jgi:hypothetical protein
MNAALGPAGQWRRFICLFVNSLRRNSIVAQRSLVTSFRSARDGPAAFVSLSCAVQCSAVQCRAVQCSAVQCSALQCSAVSPLCGISCLVTNKRPRGSAGWRRRDHNGVMGTEQCSAVQCSAVQCSAVQCSAGWVAAQPSAATRGPFDAQLRPLLRAVQCSAVQCSAVRCSAVQCNAVNYIAQCTDSWLE